MPGTYGPQTVGLTGRGVRLAADPLRCAFKAGGANIDWSAVTAVSADTTLPDGTVVKSGDKYLRYGTVLIREGGAEVQTVTFTGGPTAGNAIITVPAYGDYPARTAVAVAYNATAAAVQDALAAIVGPAYVGVTRAGAGTNADPYVYTVTFNRLLGNMPQLTSTNTFTGGTTPTVTHATGTAGVASGVFGPYDASASDGRQTLDATRRGQAYILDKTLLYSEVGSEVTGSLIEAGPVFRDRILMGGTGQPSIADVLAAFPGLELVND